VVLSTAQRRLWQLQRDAPDSAAYTLAVAWRLQGPLDPDQLRAAVLKVIETHDVLRTRYVEVDGEPVPKLGGPDEAAWSPRPATYAELAAEVARPFDLTTEPALRATLLRVADDAHLLVLRAHQIAADTWSIGVLVADLAAAYAGRPIARSPLRFTDVARWRAGVGASEDLDYWRARLAGACAAAELPPDRHRTPGAEVGTAGTYRFAFEPGLTSALRQLAAAEDTTTCSCLLAGLAALHARCTGEDDVLMGSRISGRESAAELATVVGPLASTLLLRTTLTPGMTGRELLREVRGGRLGDMEHASTSLERLAGLLPDQVCGGRPYRLQLVATDVPGVVLDLPGVEVTELPARVTTTAVDVSVSVDGLDGGPMTATVTYDADLFDERRIELFTLQLQRLLAGLVADPGAEVEALGRD